MMVTFVSECEKKALKRTRRVLDAFASRIGSRTWQTVITKEGLDAVKKLLRKTATKNSAVACHWLRSRSRSELVWIVGNRHKFNKEGIVPVNFTEQDHINSHWENDWRYLPLIKSLVGLAALFHDWAKASDFFQKKLLKSAIIADPFRHEFLSILMLNIFINGEDDDGWLSRLAEGDISTSQILAALKGNFRKNIGKLKPFKNMPDGAVMVAWLVLSHHRLPIIDKYRGEPATDFRKLLDIVTAQWGYDYPAEDKDIDLCLTYSHGLPCDSKKWLKYAQKQAGRLQNNLELLQEARENGSWRVVLHHCRLALMLADHFHSSQKKNDPKWQDELELFANTDRKTCKTKHKLVEHLVMVAKQAVRNVHFMPRFEGRNQELHWVQDVRTLKQKSPGKYRWQDKAVLALKKWRDEQGKELDVSQFGFFAVNMASTGTGKTFANAKIMRALSPDHQSLRYILALGLRTLTLQTGDEYRERIELSDEDVAVLIGSKAVLKLHEGVTENRAESEEDLLVNDLDFSGEIPDDQLSTVLPDLKSRQFLYAPVLSCTVDHLMGATETRRGGRYILPALRLLSSDLVIDEIDDFDGTDLIALGRLIHLAGMLGRKVMISSATIPPDLAEGFFNAYQVGWAIFAKSRKAHGTIGCAWVDEFKTTVVTLNTASGKVLTDYGNEHANFTTRRLIKLQQEVVKRKALITACVPPDRENKESCQDYFNGVMLDAALDQHKKHHFVDQQSGIQVSFGLIRLANITPCVELTRYLLEVELPEDTEIRTMAYHSQQLLLMRHAQEKHLDEVLDRTTGAHHPLTNNLIRQHLDSCSKPNIVFILVATPVEEVGRDHDFDWAVVEPSSNRSFIQLAGRVLRHRDMEDDIATANVVLLQHNLKGLLGKKRAFCFPGYESEANPLVSHDLNFLLQGEEIDKRLDAGPRIVKKKNMQPRENLVDLEHQAIHALLTNYESQGPESLQGWLTGAWWLTGAPQTLVRFRGNDQQVPVFLIPEDGKLRFVERGRYGEIIPIENVYEIHHEEPLSESANKRLWLHRDYQELLTNLGQEDLRKAALVYGEINLPIYGDEDAGPFVYTSQLGLVRK